MEGGCETGRYGNSYLTDWLDSMYVHNALIAPTHEAHGDERVKAL